MSFWYENLSFFASKSSIYTKISILRGYFEVQLAIFGVKMGSNQIGKKIQSGKMFLEWIVHFVIGDRARDEFII